MVKARSPGKISQSSCCTTRVCPTHPSSEPSCFTPHLSKGIFRVCFVPASASRKHPFGLEMAVKETQE